MAFFPRPVKPSVAIADLRAYFASLKKHNWWLVALAVVVPMFFITLIWIDPVKVQYREPEIEYVRMNMPNDQKIRAWHDERAKQYEAQKAEQEKTRAEFKKINEKLKKWGI